MPHPPKHRWLWFSRHDPWNPVFARYGAVVAWAKWIGMLVWAGFLASPGNPHPVDQCLAAGLAAILFLFGYRGAVSGHAHRLGSLVLATTNVCILTLQLLGLLHLYSQL